MSDSRDVLTRAAEPGTIIPYGDEEPDQVLEVFELADARATVVAIHGGFWRHEFDRSHLRPMCNALTAEGFAVVLPEYRRTGGGGGWEATYSDLEKSLDELNDELAFYDVPEKLIFVGHSAGGHMALWHAPCWPDEPGDAGPWGVDMENRVSPKASWLSGVVALAPVTDMSWCFAENLGDGAAAALMGGGPDEYPEEYDDADRTPVIGGSMAATVVHGDADDRVPVEMSRRFADESGAELRELAGVGHFELIDPLSSAWPTVLAAIEAKALL